MKDMAKLKMLVKQMNDMLCGEDEEVIDDKEQYARADDQGDMQDSEEGDDDLKVKSLAAMMKRKMGMEDDEEEEA